MSEQQLNAWYRHASLASGFIGGALRTYGVNFGIKWAES